MNIDIGFIKIALNITNFQIYNVSIADDTDQIILLKDRVIINSTDFLFNISCDYAYITDPPIFADIGRSYILFNNFDTIINGTTFFENNTINVDISKFDLTLE